MGLLSNISIRKKLMRMLLLTSSAALLLSVIGFGINDWFALRNAMFERLQTQAVIIGHNSIAALTFDDKESANTTLSSLENEEDIITAALFTSDAQLFALYQRYPHQSTPTLPRENFGLTDGHFFAVSPVELDGKGIGYTLVISDLSYWNQKQISQLTIAGAVFLLSFLFALILSSRLQRLVSEPILMLAATARKVSENQDYTLQAEKFSADEIGTLVDDFNNMLHQIKQRDFELQKAREYLEERVEARTRELTELTRQLEHLAYHDTLTGVSNRMTFDDHLRLAIDQAKRHQYHLAVFFLDLDRFKLINDTLGHAVGDKLLIEISERLTRCLRDGDTLARLGGDEFAILLNQIRHSRDAYEKAVKITEAIAEPILIDGYNLHVSSSIGISVFPEDGEEAETIVKNADTAMYRSKDRGRNQFTFFSVEMNARADRRLAVETKLRAALEQKLLKVHYQPRYDTQTLKIVGVEALARWYDLDNGTISSAEFIPLAEDCGLIASIDEWVLETACRQILPLKTLENSNLRLAVNISPAQFIREDFFDVIVAILERTGFPADRLELEITESLFGPGNVDVCVVLEKLRSLGIELSIDDFGTAYSSLSRLKQLPLNTLKIDQSFVLDLGKDVNDEVLVKTIITMAHNLNLNVVAEGVETEKQFNFVKQYACNNVQGFLFGKPMAFEHLLEHIAINSTSDFLCLT